MQMKSDRERALHTDVCIDFAIMRMDFTYASTIHCGDASMRPMKSVIILTGVPFCVRLEFNFSFKSSKVWQVWNGFREAINICIFYKPFFLRAQRSVTYHTHFNNSLSHNLNRPNNKIMSSCIYLNSRFLEHLESHDPNIKLQFCSEECVTAPERGLKAAYQCTFRRVPRILQAWHADGSIFSADKILTSLIDSVCQSPPCAREAGLALNVTTCAEATREGTFINVIAASVLLSCGAVFISFQG